MGELTPHTLVQIIPMLVVTAMLTVGLLRHQAARQQQARGILWLQAMRLLITHVQRHRGLSAGVLGGDRSLQAHMEEVRQQVNRDFEQIGSVGDWVNEHSGWQAITQHWARLAGNVYQLSVSRTIDQHNRLIKNILAFVDEIAIAHHLHSGHSRPNIWRDLLTLAEYVGQMRALGVALATGSDGAETALNKTREDLQSLSQEVLANLDTPRCRSGLDNDNLQRLLDFLAYVDVQLLRNGPQVRANDFYIVATKTLDHLFERFDRELSQLNCRLTH